MLFSAAISRVIVRETFHNVDKSVISTKSMKKVNKSILCITKTQSGF